MTTMMTMTTTTRDSTPTTAVPSRSALREGRWSPWYLRGGNTTTYTLGSLSLPRGSSPTTTLASTHPPRGARWVGAGARGAVG